MAQGNSYVTLGLVGVVSLFAGLVIGSQTSGPDRRHGDGPRHGTAAEAAAPAEPAAAPAAGMEAMAEPATEAALAEMGARIDALALEVASMSEGLAATMTGVAMEVHALGGRLETAATGSAAAPASEPPAQTAPDAAALADPDALTPSVGETVQAGSARLFLARIAEDAAHVTVVGAGPLALPLGAATDLGNGCMVTFLGRDESRAVLAPDCDAAALVPLTAAGGEALRLTVGETGLVGETRVFLSMASGGEARVKVVGGEMIEIPAGLSAEIAPGCRLGFAGVEDGAAVFQPEC